LFEVDLAAGELRKQGVRIRLQEQPFQVLAALLERPREVVTREELQARLWPGDTITDSDRGLNKAVNRVRDALGDVATNPRFIETLPQRGYRFLADVESLAIPATVTERARPPIQRRGLLILGTALIAVSIASAFAYRSFASSRPILSIAVLPLENVSHDPAQDYFSEGMTDELIGEIARITSVRVTSRTSVMRYKGDTRKSLQDIARELDADAIVEGTVTLSGPKVRITAQLIRTRDDRHLWSERYERSLSDVLALQSEIARTVASEIRAQLRPHNEQASLARSRPLDPAGYEAFVKGNYFLQKLIPGIPKSISFFNEAVRLNPGHADSHAGLAQALHDAAVFGLLPPAEAMPAARTAALKALELDQANASAHNVLAEVIKGYDWNLAGAAPEYERALELNPGHVLSHLRYAECLSRLGRHDEALAHVEQARRLDPVFAMSYGIRSMILYRARRYDESIGASHQALELDPSLVNALWWEGMSFAGKRDYQKSIVSLSRAVAMTNNPIFSALLGHVLARSGQRPEALRVLQQHTEMSKRRFVSPLDFAILYAGLGDVSAAFRSLEEAYRARSPRMHELTFPYFDDIRSDARYPDLGRRVGLPM
jgi:TolB-like protein/DNA-binding winged helix-turn-helix (wHTH) protein/Tfp pilus assembly protein PilF